jgi:ABC-2 type transport system ATP-binding protein
LTTVLNVVNPLAGNTPGSPAGVDSPFALISASAARREVGIESFMTQALLDPSSTSLTYAPDIGYDVGIISGCNLETPTGLAYFVAKQPDGGGKVYLDPQTGNLTYLPDLSSVIDPDAVETFSVVVVKPTALTSAVTGIPLVGYLASQVLVVLYQIPVVNVGFVPDHRPVQGDQGVDSAKRCHGGSHGSSRVHGEDRVSKRRHADQHQITSRQFLW